MIRSAIEKLRKRYRRANHGTPGIDRFVAEEFYSCKACGALYNASEELGLKGTQPSDNAQFNCDGGVVNYILFKRETRW
jgi:hypothetical protein